MDESRELLEEEHIQERCAYCEEEPVISCEMCGAPVCDAHTTTDTRFFASGGDLCPDCANQALDEISPLFGGP